ncbi:hypothetical protein ACFP1I_23525 [Dyadobacter subterraneus]|uniref:Lipoprotein n=1 Tax=Dyadobacter subterraneus TaxID=2773304 RepID=A0ABR9WM34_9BACT|nr:hypothetical protein [Dyadobacter subterraneus]MBE9466583.1 hypothetical protein [Dyadobacter subterraneus]
MKTQLTILRTLVTCTVLGIALSCSKSNPVVATSCEKNAEKVTNAGTAYAADPTSKTKCEAYKTAVNDFFKSCPTYYSGASKDALNDFLNTPCN